MLEVLPLSPVREWAISRSFIASRPHKLNARFCQFARQQHRCHRDHIARRFESAAAAGGAVGVKRFDLVADAHRLPPAFGAVCAAPAPPELSPLGRTRLPSPPTPAIGKPSRAMSGISL